MTGSEHDKDVSNKIHLEEYAAKNYEKVGIYYDECSRTGSSYFDGAVCAYQIQTDERILMLARIDW